MSQQIDLRNAEPLIYLCPLPHYTLTKWYPRRYTGEFIEKARRGRKLNSFKRWLNSKGELIDRSISILYISPPLPPAALIGVTEVLGFSEHLLVVAGYFKQGTTPPAADKMMKKCWIAESAGVHNRFTAHDNPQIKTVILTGLLVKKKKRLTDSRPMWYDKLTEIVWLAVGKRSCQDRPPKLITPFIRDCRLSSLQANPTHKQPRAILEAYAKTDGFSNLKWYTDTDSPWANFPKTRLPVHACDIEAGCGRTVIVKDMSTVGRKLLQWNATRNDFPTERRVSLQSMIGLDSAQGDNDFAPLALNICNEWL